MNEGPAQQLNVDAAVQLLVDAARPVAELETLDLHQALGRVLAEPVFSSIDVPGWDNSAMDGYALRASDCAGPGAELPVSQRIPAGVQGLALVPGSAARIFTGAPIPAGADTVVMQELCTPTDSGVRFDQPLSEGANIRRRGEDIRSGTQVVAAGTLLEPQHLGLAASVGIPRLQVRRRPRVVVLASGDELVMPGMPLAAGQIYNSNLFTAVAVLQGMGCAVSSMGIVEDNLDATKAALQAAALSADLVVASGGVSVGEEDHVRPAVEALGSLDMWRIAMRPGKPVAFGHVEGTPFIGCPGNPVSLFVTLLLFVRPFVLRLQGRSDWRLEPLSGKAAFAWPRPDRRREFQRARLVRDAQGELCVEVHPSRSSAVLSSVTWANGLVVIPEGCTVKRGDRVDFLPFSGLMK